MRLLRDRQFALLFTGEAINGIGSWAALIALWGYAAYKFDSGPTQIAWLGLSWAAPAALLGPFVGVFIDRAGPRRVLIWSYAAGSLIAVAMAFSDTYGRLLGLSLVYGVTVAFARPAGAALPPRLVKDDDLLAANALLGAAQESAIVFGPLLAAAIIALWGVRAAFLADAITYWVGVAVLLPLRLRQLPPAPRTKVWTEIGAGLQMARRQPVVRFVLLLSIGVHISWSTFLVVEPIYVRELLHRSPSTLGLLQTAFGVGMVGMGLLLPRLGNRVARPRAVAASVVLSGVAAALYVGTGILAVAYLGVFLWGVDVAFFSAPSRTLLQRATPVSAHGRVLGLSATVDSWASMAVVPLAGIVAASIGVRGVAFIAAAIASAAGLAGFLRAPAPPERAEAEADIATGVGPSAPEVLAQA